MIDEFLGSWPLFANAYIAGWLIAALLGAVGVLVVARDQIFLGAAVAQASMLGITVGIRFAAAFSVVAVDWYDLDLFGSLSGGVFAMVGALLTVGVPRRGRVTQEAVTGWIFAIGMAGSVLLVAHSPHGLEEVERLLASTLIGATSVDLTVFSLFCGVTALALIARWRTIVLVVMDPEMARALGVRVLLVERLLYVWLALTIAFSLRVSGMVYTFGCLVLPALFAKSVCREFRTMWLVASSVALGSAVASFIVAHSLDLPPAHVVVVMLGAWVALGWVWPGRARPARGHGQG